MTAASRKNQTDTKEKDKRPFWVMLVIIILIISTGIFFYTNPNILKKESFLTHPLKRTWDATLYFGNEQSNGLLGESRKISSALIPEEMAKALLNALICGSSAAGIRTMPKQTKVISVRIEQNGLLTVNFGPELLRFHPGGSTAEFITVYSIVNTLAENIKEVRMVQLLIDGNTAETLAGHIDISRPIYPKSDLIH